MEKAAQEAELDEYRQKCKKAEASVSVFGIYVKYILLF
jgi:hypothetical protein